MPDIELLVLNTEGTGVDTSQLVRKVREHCPGLPVLHIGHQQMPGMPADVANLAETFSAIELLTTVDRLLGDADEAPE